MGRQDESAQLFYKFSLDRHVPADHLLRQIDAVLDLSTIRRRLAPYYAVNGRLLFRQLFEQVVHMCLQAGLVGSEGFAIDASVIEADASLRRKAKGKLTAWPDQDEVSRPVREYLDALDQAAASRDEHGRRYAAWQCHLAHRSCRRLDQQGALEVHLSLRSQLSYVDDPLPARCWAVV